MDKKYYLPESYRQINNTHHYKTFLTILFPQISLKIAEILNRLRNSGDITDNKLQFVLPLINPRPHKLYILPKFDKAFNSWTFPGKMPLGSPIISDRNSELKHLLTQY